MAFVQSMREFCRTLPNLPVPSESAFAERADGWSVFFDGILRPGQVRVLPGPIGRSWLGAPAADHMRLPNHIRRISPSRR